MVQLSRELAGQTLVENAGFSRKPGRRVSPLELSSKLGEGARDCPLHDTRERKRLSFENVKRRGWIKGGGKATRTPSLSHGAIWIPWKSVTAAFRGSLATRRAADSLADGCYSYGLDGNIWIPEGSVYGASFFEEWLNEVAIRPGCRRSGAARFNVSGLRRVEWWMDI